MAPCPPRAAASEYQFCYNYGDPTDFQPNFEPQDVMGFTPLPQPPQNLLVSQTNDCYVPLRRSRSHGNLLESQVLPPDNND